MSTNQLRHRILVRQTAHGILQVFEMSNEHSHLDNDIVFSADTTKSVYFYPRTYTWFEIRQYYVNEPFHYADITITNRFTMESTKMTVRMFDDDMSFETKKVIDTKKASCVYATAVTQDQFNLVRLTLSMYDFMYGDVCLQFYNQSNKADIDAYDAPIIFQFTNAPTVFTGDIYKLSPGDTEATSAEAYDNVFSASFGTKLLNKADSGRTNVLLPTVAESECYNDFLSADRLMTNGCVDLTTESNPTCSLSGHPIYIAEYTCIVPSAFASAFGTEQYPVDFVPFNNDEHAYLTLSADNLSAMYKDTQRLSMITNADSFTPHSAMPVFSATRDDSATTIDCAIRTYSAYLATSPENRHDDAWFREHMRLCADFVLTGIDPYWMSTD